MKTIHKTILILFLSLPFSCQAVMPGKKAKMAAVTLDDCHKMKNPKKPFILILRRGEPFADSIIECIQRMNISSASVSGFGAIENPIVAAYNLRKRYYMQKEFPGIYQLASLNGTVSLSPKNQLVTHIHIVFTDPNYRAFGGHLMGGECGITAEITIIPLMGEIHREHDHDIGLDLMVSGR